MNFFESQEEEKESKYEMSSNNFFEDDNNQQEPSQMDFFGASSNQVSQSFPDTFFENESQNSAQSQTDIRKGSGLMTDEEVSKIKNKKLQIPGMGTVKKEPAPHFPRAKRLRLQLNRGAIDGKTEHSGARHESEQNTKHSEKINEKNPENKQEMIKHQPFKLALPKLQKLVKKESNPIKERRTVKMKQKETGNSKNQIKSPKFDGFKFLKIKEEPTEEKCSTNPKKRVTKKLIPRINRTKVNK